MSTLSIFTTMTNPDSRNDPWREALNCYEYFSDEIIITGQDWPNEFSWEHIGKTFQEGLDKCSSDWAMRMDIDYFLHEKDRSKLRKLLDKYSEFPALSLPQYQIFTPNRYQIKTRICLIFNKKYFKNIRLDGGGDLTLATLNNILIDPKKVPMLNVPIFQYESTFRTKEIIKTDRARFARAWNRYFGNYEKRGGSDPDVAYQAWFDEIIKRYPKHCFKLNQEDHPKFIQKSLRKIQPNQFGFNAFGLKDSAKFPKKYLLKGLREKYLNPLIYIKNDKNLLL